MRSSSALTIVLAAAAAACAPNQPAPAECPLTFTDKGNVRVIAIGHRVTLADASSYAAFEASWRRHLPDIQACLSTTRPNLLLFPEDAGLVAWFIGREALAARGAGDTGTAFNLLYGGAWRASDAYRKKYPGISSARALTLSLADRAFRAMDWTFGGIAKETGAYVITSANLPNAHESTRSEDQQFRDPDGAQPTYVADGPEVFNAGLVYGPTGERIARVNKVYLTDTEEDLLDLSNGPLPELEALKLPFGSVGIAISRDAWYPPFTQRMDDLGVELVSQQEAFGGWTQEELPGDWLPDVMLASSWSSTQKYAGLRHSAMPILTGNVLSVVFDGQATFTSQAVPGGAAAAFVGTAPEVGLDQVGPWAFEEDTSGTIDERRARLREQGKKLLPGSGAKEEGRTADSLLGADLELIGNGRGPQKLVTDGAWATNELAPSSAGHQSNPVLAWDGAGHAWAAWTDTRSGRPQTFFARSSDDGATWSAAKAVAASADRQLRPAIAAADDGRLVIAWQEQRGALEQVRVARSNDGGASFGTYWVEDGAGAQLEPSVAMFTGGAHVVAWTDFRGGLSSRVRVRCWDGVTVPPSRVIDDSQAALTRANSSQVQPSLVGTAIDKLTIGWLDYRGRSWHVRAASGALCSQGVESVQLSESSEREVLAADPQLALGSDGSLAAAWDEIRDRRGIRDVRASRFSGGAWTALPAPPRTEHNRFRAFPYFQQSWKFLVQDQEAVKNGLSRWAGDATAPVRFDGTGSATNQLWQPKVAMKPGSATGIVVFTDDRSGFRRLRAGQL